VIKYFLAIQPLSPVGWLGPEKCFRIFQDRLIYFIASYVAPTIPSKYEEFGRELIYVLFQPYL
jgi:hypothetical protein